MIDLFLQVGWRWDYTSTASALASAAATLQMLPAQQTKMIQQCVINFLRQLPVPLQQQLSWCQQQQLRWAAAAQSAIHNTLLYKIRR